MTAVPLIPTVAVTCFAVLVALLRWIFVRDSATDRLINRALGSAGIGMLLAIVSIRFAAPTAVTHLGAMVGYLTASSVYGVARMLAGANPQDARRRQRRYDLVAVTAAVLTVLIDVAIALDSMPPETASRWYAFSAAVTCVPLAVAGFLLIRAGIGEIRCAETPIAQRVTYIALIGVGAFWICYAVLVLVRSPMGVSPSDQGEGWSLSGFAFFAVITALLAIPLVRMLLIRIGWDRDSRDCRTLQPLWTDLTAAVPHIVLVDESHPRGPALRRYRMAIEIRDALLHLRRHASEYPPEDVRRRTLRIVHAAESGLVAAGTNVPGSHDLELRYLLAMATRWPKAKRACLAVDRSPRLSPARGSR
jgi:xanthosine utilization system XapX-like protein